MPLRLAFAQGDPVPGGLPQEIVNRGPKLPGDRHVLEKKGASVQIESHRAGKMIVVGLARLENRLVLVYNPFVQRRQGTEGRR